MIAATMPTLTIHHKTEYRYAHPVAFGEHRIMLRPRDGHDLRVLSSELEIVPQPMRLRWIHDVFGNPTRCRVLDQVVFKIQRAQEQPSFPVVQFHERGVGQVEFAFE